MGAGLVTTDALRAPNDDTVVVKLGSGARDHGLNPVGAVNPADMPHTVRPGMPAVVGGPHGRFVHTFSRSLRRAGVSPRNLHREHFDWR